MSKLGELFMVAFIKKSFRKVAPPPWQRSKGIPDCEKHAVQVPSEGWLFPPIFHMVGLNLSVSLGLPRQSLSSFHRICARLFRRVSRRIIDLTVCQYV